MGSSASKAAQKAPRKYPSRAPGATPTAAPSPRRPAPRQAPQASYTKDDAILTDAADPDLNLAIDAMSPTYADRLQQMGVVQPNPTFSPSSTAASASFREQQSFPAPGKPRFPPSSSNTTLSVLEARQRLQDRAVEEFAHDRGKEFLDVGAIRQILVLRDRGVDAAAIESRLHLKPGVVARLGRPGLVAPLGHGPAADADAPAS